MGVSTDGIICMGIPFEEHVKFPWHNEEYGNRQDALEEWWGKEFRGQHLPVEMVNYCSAGVPMYILAVKGTVQDCSRGCPIRLQLPLERAPIGLEEYLSFLITHLRPEDWEYLNENPGFAKPKEDSSWIPEPGWLLCSYWSA